MNPLIGHQWPLMYMDIKRERDEAVAKLERAEYQTQLLHTALSLCVVDTIDALKRANRQLGTQRDTLIMEIAERLRIANEALEQMREASGTHDLESGVSVS
jgi:predicted nucleic acid-binding protein